MDELNKARGICMTGPCATGALSEFRTQVARWGVALPMAEPLVLDFGLGCFEETGLIECWIANEMEAGYCGKYLFVFDGQTCPTHCHREKHETFFVVQGLVSIACDGRVESLKMGQSLAVPAGIRHSFTGIGPALLLEISKPCVVDDNYFEDGRIPIGGNYRGRPS